MKRILYILLLFPILAHARSIHITTLSDTVCSGSMVSFYATDTGVLAPHFHWEVNHVNKGSDTSVFITDSLNNGDTVLCLLTNLVGDTVFATSDNIIVSVQSVPFVALINGPRNVCVHGTITLSDSTAGGIWSASNTNATVSGGIVTGVNDRGPWGGRSLDTITYSINNSGCINIASVAILIQGLPNAGFNLEGGTLCVGSSLMVNYNYGGYGRMYSANGYVSCGGSYVTAVHAGTDQIYNIATNSCGSDTFSISVTVLPAPAPPFIILSSKNLCVGSSITLVDLAPGNANSWYITNNNAVVNIYSGLITGAKPGLDTIVLSASGYCASSRPAYLTTTINILPPKQITGFDSFCIGGLMSFTDSTAGGIWSSSNANIVSIDQSGTANILAQGVTKISYAYGSCVVSKPIKINPPLPPLTGIMSFCRGASMAFSTPAKGGIWYTNDTVIVSVDSTKGIVTGRENGTATITYQLSGCVAATGITIKQEHDNITGDSIICTNTAATLTADSNGHWSTANTTIAHVDIINGQVWGVSAGYATITYSHLHSVCYDTFAVTVINCDHHVNIFPNPTIYEIIIDADLYYYHAYSITNMLGQTVYQGHISKELTNVNVQLLPKGIYFITIYGYDDNRFFKFLKE